MGEEPTQDLYQTEPARVGVYICHCGTNIAGVVDVDEVADYAATIPGVVVSKAYRYMCSDTGQELIREDIEELKLNRIVVAACSPRLHEPTFRNTAIQAGLNQFLFEMANIREQNSWVHMRLPMDATEKAKDLVRMAVGKAILLEPLETRELPVNPSVLVIGGGMSGITSALDIANAGFKTWLVEREPSLGGNAARLTKTYPFLNSSIDILCQRMQQAISHPNIEVLVNSEVAEVKGHIGEFEVTISQKAQYVDPKLCKACGDCAKVCPEETASKFNLGMSTRKAIDLPFPHAVPAIYTIDEEACTKCGKCVEVCKENAINLNATPQTLSLDPGLMIVATGAEPFDASTYAPYNYQHPNVITGPELERMLDETGPTGGEVKRPSDGKLPKKIAFVQCAGSRNKQIGNEYCSRICCMYAIKEASLLKDKYPKSQIDVFYMDIRAFGKGNEEFYDETAKKGVRFTRGRVAQILTKENSDNPVIRVEDTLLAEHRKPQPIFDLAYDLVVLSVGLVPPQGLLDLAKKLNISLSGDGFLLEKHPKLAPVDTATRGVYICGAVQGPKDLQDSINQARGAASSVLSTLIKETVEVEPYTAEVNEILCRACGICEKVCPYHAISVDTVSHVEAALCAGCGICVAECPVGAIDLKHFKTAQIRSQLYSFFGSVSEKQASKFSEEG
ncbi:MAG: 4Fe-4S binding protein [Candidatus Hodarchaeota archaeon]